MLTIRTLAQYRTLRAMIDTFDSAHRTKYGAPRTWGLDTPLHDPSLPREPTADERGAVEQWETWQNPPERLFAYVDEPNRQLITFAGHVLAVITHLGAEYRSNMGDRRRPIRVRLGGKSQVEYHGTYYVGMGTYARLKRGKPPKR